MARTGAGSTALGRASAKRDSNRPAVRRRLARLLLGLTLTGLGCGAPGDAPETGPRATAPASTANDAPPTVAPPRTSAERLPNVVFLVADDQGFGDFGFMGSPHVETPNLDRLAERSVVFRQGRSTASVCAPALRTLLTGLDPVQYDHETLRARLDLWKPRAPSILGSLETLPRMLSRRGYASFQSGKYGESHYSVAGFSAGTTTEGNALSDRGVDLAPIFSFIDAQDAPFFLFFAPMVPHLPHTTREDLVARYRDRGFSTEAVHYYASCSWFDELAGRVLDHLEARGVLDDTLVFVMADNGWDQGPHARSRDPDTSVALAGPKGKLSLYEIGLRTPILVSWPRRFAGGQTSDALVSLLDIVPTVLDYAELPAPGRLLGHSLRPLVEGDATRIRRAIVTSMQALRPAAGARAELPLEKAAAQKHGRRLYRVRQTAYNVRNARWSYIDYHDAGVEELYDLQSDPRQEHDLAGERPELLPALRRVVVAHRRSFAEQALAALDPATFESNPRARAYRRCLLHNAPYLACRDAIDTADRADPGASAKRQQALDSMRERRRD